MSTITQVVGFIGWILLCYGAAALGSTQTITSLEVGKYTASLVLAYKIATYFGLTIEDVFDFTSEGE